MNREEEQENKIFVREINKKHYEIIIKHFTSMAESWISKCVPLQCQLSHVAELDHPKSQIDTEDEITIINIINIELFWDLS